jgi:hypothetical protein
MQRTPLRGAADAERWDDPRSPGTSTVLAVPHHLWYTERIRRLVAWENTLSLESFFSVLKEGVSQCESGCLI